MGDGAKAITKAGEAVFDVSTTRLMCWAHVHAKIVPKLKSVSTHNKKGRRYHFERHRKPAVECFE